MKIANTNIPKILWIYWQQGWNCAPDIVKACLNTWRNRNPNWEIITLDDTNLKNYIDINQIQTILSNKIVEPEAFSDILRAALLSKHGGVWADSTTFCVVRLDNWLSPYVDNNFFAFSNPGKDRLISSWFIASEPSGYIINKWWSAVLQYWKEHHTRHHYFWFHYLFNDLYSSDKEFKNIWDLCPKLSANGPHRFTPYSSLYEEVKADDITAINSRKFPIFKLTHKLDTSLIKSDSLYDYLVTESYRVPSNGYFPNKSPQTMNLEQKFRKAITTLPENEKLSAYECYTKSSPDLVDTSFEAKEKFIIVSQNGSMINFPKPLPLIKYSHIAYGYEQWLERKYSLPGFVTVEKDDVIFDCGSYVGGFSLHASRIARMIYCFEPSKENYECIKRNFKCSPNITVLPIGLYNADDILEFNISASSVEHSFLPPDDGEIIGIEKVPVKRIDTICKENNIEQIDFLKIEAEGVEIEVFEGLGNLRPKKIAIDVSPERNGKSPADFFIKKLPKLGYLIKLRGNVLFARKHF